MAQKIINALIIIILFLNTANAQKPVIDTVAINHWAHINGEKLSADGDYVYYSYVDENGRENNAVESLEGSWKREQSNVQFTNDGKSFIYQSGDSLFLESLGKNDAKFIARISSCKLLTGNKKQWLSYRPADEPTDLVIVDLATKKELKREHVLDYRFSSINNIVIVRECKDGASY